jgi:hypothetical protein
MPRYMPTSLFCDEASASAHHLSQIAVCFVRECSVAKVGYNLLEKNVKKTVAALNSKVPVKARRPPLQT